MGLKLEAGKYYRTRAGDKVYVAAVAGIPAGVDTVTHFTALAYAQGHSILYTACGRYSLSQVSPWDILYEWQEPVKLTRWAAVVTSSSPGVRSRGEVLCFFEYEEDAQSYINKFEGGTAALVPLTGTLEC
jgi:hypothetical protein